MSHDIETQLRNAQLKLAETETLLAAVTVNHAALKQALNGALRVLETGVTLNAPTFDGPVCDHRKAHKPGRPAKLDTDAELRAFVVARLERLTFKAISAEVKANFPPHRHIGHSALHAWYRRTYG